MILVDIELSRLLEATEGRASAEFIQTRQALQPGTTSCATQIAGTNLLFDGQESPLTQTFGLGVAAEITAAELASMEAFFEERGAPTQHEVSPLASPGLLQLLHERGYYPIELTTVMVQPLDGIATARCGSSNQLATRAIQPEECDRWAEVAAAGWASEVPFAELLYDLSRLTAHRSPNRCFWVEQGSAPIATGAMFLCGPVALMAGASTIPQARRQGAQRALLLARLQAARSEGCEFAMMCAAPGSASQRNAQRQGFQIAYTRIKWRRDVPSLV